MKHRLSIPRCGIVAFAFVVALRSTGANGLLVGGEVSLIRFWDDKDRFLGGYLDYLYDRGARTHRVSAGPELGLSWTVASVGFDAGPVVEIHADY